jgi:hypothetical protein
MGPAAIDVRYRAGSGLGALHRLSYLYTYVAISAEDFAMLKNLPII